MNAGDGIASPASRIILPAASGHFIFVSAAISSLPSAVLIVSFTFLTAARWDRRGYAISVLRVGFHVIVEQYRIAAFQRDAQRPPGSMLKN